MTQAITKAMTEAAKAAIMAVREAETLASTTRPEPAMPKTDHPVLKQPMFNWKSPDKYRELCNFEIEVKKHLLN